MRARARKLAAELWDAWPAIVGVVFWLALAVGCIWLIERYGEQLPEMAWGVLLLVFDVVIGWMASASFWIFVAVALVLVEIGSVQRSIRNVIANQNTVYGEVLNLRERVADLESAVDRLDVPVDRLR